MTPVRAALTILFSVLIVWPPANAQVGDAGQIQGTVTDTTGAVVPGATVTATALATNQRRQVITDEAGRYTFLTLPIGEYTLLAELTGFKTAVRQGITLSVQEVAVIDIALEIGEVTERIEVTAAAPLLQTSTTSQGSVIDSNRIQSLPLNGRDYVQLALLSEGAARPIGGRFGGFSAGGQRTSQNNYMLNGVDNNDLEIASQGRQAEVVKPIVDAIQEFKLETNAYSAQFGKATGGVLNLRIKSGTNDLHGSAWEFFRNDVLDSRNFFNKEGSPKAPFVRNQFGGSIGGAAIKDKLFYFGAVEWQRRRESTTAVSTLATPLMRQGEFSEISNQIFDPGTYDPGAGTRQPFPNNIIPQDRIDSISTQLVDLIPLPQTTSLTRNFSFSRPLGFNDRVIDTRVDLVATDSDNLAFALDWSKRFLEPDPLIPGPLGGADQFSFSGVVLSGQWNHVFRPNFITSTKAAWNRRYTARTSPQSENLASKLGINGVNHDVLVPPAFNITGFRNLGGPNFTPNLIQSQNRQIRNDTTVIKGSHQIQFGANVQRLQSFLTNPQVGAGVFRFTGAFSRNPLGNVGGNGFADFLLGFSQSAETATSVFFDMRSWHNSFYVQDTWKATPNLTFNLGLRYELFLPWQDKRNGIANFHPDLRLTPQAELIVAMDGPSRIDRSLIRIDKNNIAPRFGFAYRWKDNTVIRAAYGIFYGAFEGTGGGEFLETNPPFNIRPQLTTDSINPTLVLSQGLPPSLTPENVQSPRLSSYERDFNYPTSQQWNLNIQRTFARDWMVQVGYFGANGHYLVQAMDLNQPRPGPGNVNARRPFQSVIFPGTERLISPISGFQSHTFNGNSSYHSGQFKLEKQFSQGFTILSSYIFSKTIGDTCGFGSGSSAGCGIQDVRNLKLEKSLDDIHGKHRFVVSYIWELPFGRNQRFGRNWGGALNAILGGWNIDGIVSISSGAPFSLLVPGDPANVGGVARTRNRPNLVGDPTRPSGVDRLDQFFNIAAFERNAPFTFGNVGRNTLIGPTQRGFDFGVFRNFSVKEGVAVQFRFEAFNVTNTPHFDNPNNSVGTGDFGQISSTLTNNRKLQFGLKIVF